MNFHKYKYGIILEEIRSVLLTSWARDYFTILLWKSPVQIDLRTLRALGWGEPPTNNIFIYKPTPRSNFCLLAPAQFSKHTPHLVGWTLRVPGLGEPPTNKILHGKPTPRSKYCLLAPTQFFTLQGFSEGSLWGLPPGVNIWGRPLARCRSPCQISGW
jgi:hypothetical protein